MAKKTKPTRGGARPGAGRKPAPIDKATTTLAFRGPVAVLDPFKQRHGKHTGARLVQLIQADLADK